VSVQTSTEQQLTAILRRRTSAFAALIAGAKLAARTATVGVPVSVVYGLVSGIVGYQVMQATIGLQQLDQALVETWFQITAAAALFLALYLMVQIPKSRTASRASWAPAMFAAPLAFTAIALYLVSSGQARQIGPVVLQLTLMAWGIVWMTFGGAFTALAWLRAARNVLDGKSAADGVLAESAARTLEVAGPHGARVHAVTIGMQFLLPGIFYALQLAFVDMVVVLDPEKASLRRAGQLSSGMRGRLFLLLLLWSLGTYAVWFAVLLPLEGATTQVAAIEKFQELFLDPSSSSRLGYVVGEVLWSLSAWVCELALLVLYLEREEQVRARSQLKAMKQDAPSTNPYDAPRDEPGAPVAG
jgi:hypothetical protein